MPNNTKNGISGTNRHDRESSKKPKVSQSAGNTSDISDFSGLIESVPQITDPQVMDALVDKLLTNELLTKTLADSLKIPEIIAQEVESHNSSVLARLDAIEQYSRRNCLKIAGIPESAGENTDDLLLALSNDKLNLNIDVQDMELSHRVGPKRSVSHRDIKVSFLSYRTRAIVYQSRFKLFKLRLHDRIYINESPTKPRMLVMKEVRSFRKPVP